MENINPTLILVLELRRGIEAGDTVKAVLTNYLKNQKCEFRQAILRWYTALQNRSEIRLDPLLQSPARKTLLLIIERGLKGEPILKTLEQLEFEIRESCYAELEEIVAKMPFKVLVPLLLLIFPSVMYLMLAPILSALLTSQQ